MNTAEIEQQPIIFSSPASALGWADAIIAVGRCDSQTYRIMRDAVQQGVIRATGGYTLEDIRYEAHDISNALRSVQPYHEACAYRHLYGLPSAHESLQPVFSIAEKLEPGAEGLRRAKLRALVLAALNSEKQAIIHDRPYSMSKFASSVGITKQTFSCSTKWVELQVEAITEVRSMLDAAEKKFSQALQVKGVL